MDFFGPFVYTTRRMARPETLDDLLLAVGLPLGDVAEQSGLDPKSLLKLRRGTVASPRIATLAALSKVLKVTPERVRAAIAASRAAAEKG